MTPCSKSVIFFIPGWGFKGSIFELAQSDCGASHILLPLCLSAGEFYKVLPDGEQRRLGPKAIPILYPRECSWKISIEAYIQTLLELKRSGKKIHLMGWSLGAILALKVANQAKQIVTPHGHTRSLSTCLLESLWLISLRRRFSSEEIDNLKAIVERDKRVGLRLFYRDCFKGQESQYRKFKDGFERNYVESFTKEELLEGLDFLKNNPVEEISAPDGLRTILVHGTLDKIAPIEDIPKVKSGVKYQFVEGCGHLPFLCKDVLTQTFMTTEIRHPRG